MAILTCPDCGGKVSSLALFCPHCGRPVKSFAESDSEKSSLDHADKPSQEPAAKEFCPQCKDAVPAGALVCARCNFDLNGYKENLKAARFVKMEPVDDPEHFKNVFFREHYKRAAPVSGCIGLIFLAQGFEALELSEDQLRAAKPGR